MKDCENKTLEELKQYCRDNNIRGFSRKKKQELIYFIKEYHKNNSKDNDKIDDNDKIKKNNLKFIDLFCGIGGFHTVLKSLGHNCVFASDLDKNCREVYENNYNLKPEGDIKNIEAKDIPDFDILCGGFPCQSFSNGGKKKAFDDARGLLFDEIIRIAKIKKPKFMFLENVKHILKVDNGKVFEYILNNLDKINYKIQIFQMSPHQYGIPQQRERVYFVCIRKDIYKDTDVNLIYDKEDEIDLDKYLDKKEDIDEEYFLKGDLLNVLNAWDEMIKIFEVDEKISPVILVNEFYRNYTDEEFNKLAKWKKDYITKNKPLYKKYKKEWDKWYDKHKNLLSKREIYAKFDWQVGKIKENDSIFKYFIQIRQSGIRVKKAKFFPTLVAISQIPILGKENRYLTPRECARIQSFPDNFKLSDNKKVSYKQLGNSVNVENVKNVIESTLKLYIKD